MLGLGLAAPWEVRPLGVSGSAAHRCRRAVDTENTAGRAAVAAEARSTIAGPRAILEPVLGAYDGRVRAGEPVESG